MLALMFGVAVAERVFSAYRWYTLVSGKSPAANFYTVSRITFISNFLGLMLPGSIGTDLVRIHGLARLTGDLAMSFTSVLVERFLGLLALVILAFIGLAVLPEIMPVEFNRTAWLCLALLIAGSVTLMSGHGRAIARRLFDFSFLAFARSRLDKLFAALDAYRMQPALLAWAFVLAFGLQLIRVALFIVGAWALGLNVPMIYFLLVVPGAVIAQMLPISIAGLGVRELSLVSLLSLVNVSPEAAISLSLMSFLMRALAGGLPGAIFYVFTRTGLEVAPLKE